MDERSRTFVVCTDETGRYDASVATALRRAKAEGVRVILYDVTAPGSPLTSPRPNEWSGEGERERYEHPLGPIDLERLGRHLLASQVMHARERGIDAYGWLPEKPGGDVLAEYAAREGADLVLLPTDLAEPEIAETPGLHVERV